MKDSFVLRIIGAILFISCSWLFLTHYEEISFQNIETVEQQIEELPEGEYIVDAMDQIPYEWKNHHFTIFFILTSMAYITMSILGINKIFRILIISLVCIGIKYIPDLDWLTINYFAVALSCIVLTCISIVYSVISWFGKIIFDH